jgi:hypothetical protein
MTRDSSCTVVLPWNLKDESTSQRSNAIPNELLALAALGGVDAAMALALAMAFPTPADDAAVWLGVFPG